MLMLMMIMLLQDSTGKGVFATLNAEVGKAGAVAPKEDSTKSLKKKIFLCAVTMQRMTSLVCLESYFMEMVVN